MECIVMIKKYGYATIKGNTDEEILKKTNDMKDEEFDWAKRDWMDSEIVGPVDDREKMKKRRRKG